MAHLSDHKIKNLQKLHRESRDKDSSECHRTPALRLPGSTGSSLTACLDSSKQSALGSLVCREETNRVLFRRQAEVVAGEG